MSIPIIYLHGFASSPQSKKARLFEQRMQALGIEIRVPDLAAGDFENLTISGQLRVIEQTADGKPVALMGSSLGGYLAALYASLHPEVSRLVLLAPAFGFARRWPERLGEATMERWRRTGKITLFHYGEERDRDLNYSLIEDGLQFPDYPAVRQPTLIYHGNHDDVVPAAWSHEFSAQNPSAELRVVDSGHDLMSAFEEIWQGASQFLAGAR
jgi:uncharacterized protein